MHLVDVAEQLIPTLCGLALLVGLFHATKHVVGLLLRAFR
jgi:hypothetical protein